MAPNRRGAKAAPQLGAVSVAKLLASGSQAESLTAPSAAPNEELGAPVPAVEESPVQVQELAADMSEAKATAAEAEAVAAPDIEETKVERSAPVPTAEEPEPAAEESAAEVVAIAAKPAAEESAAQVVELAAEEPEPAAEESASQVVESAAKPAAEESAAQVVELAAEEPAQAAKESAAQVVEIAAKDFEAKATEAERLAAPAIEETKVEPAVPACSAEEPATVAEAVATPAAGLACDSDPDVEMDMLPPDLSDFEDEVKEDPPAPKLCEEPVGVAALLRKGRGGSSGNLRGDPG